MIVRNVGSRDKTAKVPSFIEVHGAFITKPADIANYCNTFFINKVNAIRVKMIGRQDSSISL